MKLTHKKIHEQFLTALPEGIKFIKKHGKDYLVIEQVFCPRGHDLVVDSVHIHGEPSVKLQVKVGKSEGLVFVDAFWGGHAKLYNFIPDIGSAGQIVETFCPNCEADMIVEEKCRQDGCDSDKAVLFVLPGGRNKIYVCAKLGCPGHRMDIIDLPSQVSEQVSGINYFGAQMDDILMEI